jgi:dextranase
MRRVLISVTLALALILSMIPIAVYAVGRIERTRLEVPTSTGNLINRVFTDKARYLPSSTVTITTRLDNKTGSTWNGNLDLTITHLESTLHTASQAVSISAGSVQTKTFTWTTPATDFQGYQVQVAAGTSDYNASAIDVSSDWTRYPRYGYIHNFASNQTTAQSRAKIAVVGELSHRRRAVLRLDVATRSGDLAHQRIAQLTVV